MQKLILVTIGLWTSFCLAKATASSDPMQKILIQGLENSFLVQKQEVELQKSALQLKDSWANFLPTVTLSANQIQQQSESLSDQQIDNTYSLSRSADVTGSWNLWNNYKNIRDQKLASLNYSKIKIFTHYTKQNYSLQLITSFLKYQVELSKQEILKLYLEQTQSNLSQSQLLVKIGARTEFDSLDAEVEHLGAQRDLMDYENNLKLSKKELQTLLSCEKCDQFEKIDLLNYKPFYQTQFEKIRTELKNENIESLFRKNPSYKMSQLDSESSIERIQQTRMAAWPELSASIKHSVDLSRQIQDEPSGGRRANLNDTTFSIGLSWQLWDWFTTSRRIQSSELDFKVEKNEIKDALQNARTEIQLMLDQLQIAEKSLEISKLALEKASKQVKFSQDLYRYGKITLTQVQQSMSRLKNAQNFHADRLKDKYILMAKALVLVDVDLAP